MLIHPISVRSPARAQACIFSFFLSVLIHRSPVRIHGVFGMGTETGAHPPGPLFESRASKFSFFILSVRIIPPLDKRFRGGERINTQTMRATAGSDHPFASCQGRCAFARRSHVAAFGGRCAWAHGRTPSRARRLAAPPQVLRNLRVPLAEGGLHDGIQCW